MWYVPSENEVNSKLSKRDLIKEIIILTIAIFIVAVAVFFFLIPSHAAVSSITGFAIVLSNFVPLAVSDLTFIMNIFLLIAGFLICGKEFGAKTVYTTTMLPVFLKLFETLMPNNQSLTGDATLDVVSYIFVLSTLLNKS